MDRFNALLGVVAATIGLVTSAGAETAAKGEKKKPAKSYMPSRLLSTSRAELAMYVDTDAVTVVTPALWGEVHDPLSGWSVTGNYLVDVVSAASVDIVSTASPDWQEVRQAAAIEASYRPGSLGGGLGASISVEPDYVSYGFGLNGVAELANKMATLELGLLFEHDIAGLKDTPFSVYSLTFNRYGASASVELIANRATTITPLLEVFYDVGRQEEPYRYLPLFAPDVAPQVPAGASPELVNQLRLPPRVAENLPDTRARLALSGRLAHRFEHSTLLAFERLYADDWGLFASTTDLRYVLEVGDRWSFWPHGRANVQSAASFWRRAYVGSVDGRDVPTFRSGDRELGPLWSATLGPGARWDLGSADKANFSALFALEGTYTHFSDALYIQQRWAGFASAQIEVGFK